MASASSSRRDILVGAGLDITVDPAKIDEQAFKDRHCTLGLYDVARGLATEKAQSTAARHPGSIVIGADQTMECDGTAYDKPAHMTAARRHLQQLRGRVHTLHSAVCIVRDQEVLWSIVDDAHMTMRDFDNGFLEDYLTGSGKTVLTSVGCYRLEGTGAHLFSHIDGDFFTILGLPLLPLLGFLREMEILH